MKKSIFLGLSLLLTAAAHSQNSTSSDQAAEEVAITKAVINQLFAKRSNDNSWLSDDGAHVAYYPGFGFLILAPRLVEQPSMYYAGEGKVTIQGKIFPAPNIDSLVAVRSKRLSDNIYQYFSQYARLLSTLQPGEKIKLLYDHWIVNESFVRPMASINSANKGAGNFKGITAEVKYETLQQYTTGQLTKENFLKKINITQNIKKDLDQTDLTIMASILTNLINKELGATMVNQVKLNYIEGFGVVFEAPVQRFPMFKWGGSAEWTDPIAPNPPTAPMAASAPRPPAKPSKRNSTDVHTVDDNEEVIVIQSNGISSDSDDPKMKAKSDKKVKMNRKEARVEECVEDLLENQEVMIERALVEANRAVERANIRGNLEESFAYYTGEPVDLLQTAKQLRMPLLKYATTLSSLKEDELILLKLTSGSKKEVSLRVPMKVVRQLERKEISEQKALDAVVCTE